MKFSLNVHIHTQTQKQLQCRSEMSKYIKINVRRKFRNMKGNCAGASEDRQTEETSEAL